MAKTININVLFIAGNLTADPQVKTIGDRTVTTFTVATHRSYRTNNGRQTETTFVPCECWGTRGEGIAKHLRKGQGIFVQARLEIDVVKDAAKGTRVYPKAVVTQWTAGGFVDSTKPTEEDAAAT